MNAFSLRIDHASTLPPSTSRAYFTTASASFGAGAAGLLASASEGASTSDKSAMRAFMLTAQCSLCAAMLT